MCVCVCVCVCVRVCTCVTCFHSDGSDLSQTRKILIGLGIPDPSDEDCRTVRRACEAVSTRAARLAAGMGGGVGVDNTTIVTFSRLRHIHAIVLYVALTYCTVRTYAVMW